MGRYETIMKALHQAFRINQDGELEQRRAMFPIHRDYLTQFDDFEGVAINVTDGKWGSLIEDNGSQVIVDLETYGRLIISSGTDDNGLAALFGGIQWQGDKSVEMICRVITSATITTTKIEVGLTDADDDNGVWGVLAEDGSGDTASDAIIFIWDTDKHATTLWVAGTKNGTGWGGVDTGVTIEASTTYEFKIVLADDNAKMYYKKIGTHTKWQLLHEISDNTALTKTIKLTPWIFIQARANAANRDAYIDWVYLRQFKA